MSINDQIEAAWRCYVQGWEIFPDEHSRRLFADGFSVAKKSVYRDLKPEDCCDSLSYWILLNGKWTEATFYHGFKCEHFFEYDGESNGHPRSFTVDSSEVSRIVKAIIPSPAEVFGEGV